MQRIDHTPYYLTTAIAYTSGKPHIGNCYEAVLADSIVRFRRAQGYDVRFQTGTDEHGLKIEQKAEAAGVTPQTFVDGVAGQIKDIWDSLNISYDRFIRTTDADHMAEVQKIFKKLYDQGDIYKGKYEGWYCVPDESFFTESQVVDQDGVKVCPDCGRPVVKASEEAYFFRMSKYAPRLIDYINSHPDFIWPVSRKNEMMNNFLLPGLQDLCVSRTSFTWGIPVSFDEKHVVYVWLDALSNYITGLGYHVDGANEELYNKYWPADVHIIGKDILRFHTIYWPIFLMALGLPLPKQVFGHPWLLQSGGKMSKSKGNVIYADQLIEFFGLDAVRYFVLHEMPYENDGVVGWELIMERINSDLANTLGNLVNRTIAMSNKYFGGAVVNGGVEDSMDADFKAQILAAPAAAEKCMETLHVADAITEVMNLFKRCNKYIDETMPWALAKDEAQKARLQTVLYNLAEGITIGASLLAPFLPDTADKIFAQLGTQPRAFWEMDRFGLNPDGKVCEKPEILFARLDIKEVMKKVVERFPGMKEEAPAAEEKAAPAKAGDAKPAAQETPSDKAEGADKSTGSEPAPAAEEPAAMEHKATVTYDDFDKLELRIGRILACEAVPKSKKLLCSKVQVGSEVRQILSGIKAWYSPEEMVGKRVMIVANLAPRKIAGMESQGMILCAEDEEGNLALMTPEKDIADGSEVC